MDEYNINDIETANDDWYDFDDGGISSNGNGNGSGSENSEYTNGKDPGQGKEIDGKTPKNAPMRNDGKVGIFKGILKKGLLYLPDGTRLFGKEYVVPSPNDPYYAQLTDTRWRGVIIEGSYMIPDTKWGPHKCTLRPYLIDNYLPIINRLNVTKGMRLLCTAFAINEGFDKGTRNARYNNPGNIGNTDGGHNTKYPSLEAGIQAQIDFFTKTATGTYKWPWKHGPKTIDPGYSDEIAKNPITYKKSPYLPGFKFDYQGQLAAYIKNYGTAPRSTNKMLNIILSYFHKMGVTITPHDTINSIINIK